MDDQSGTGTEIQFDSGRQEKKNRQKTENFQIKEIFDTYDKNRDTFVQMYYKPGAGKDLLRTLSSLQEGSRQMSG